MYFLTSLKNIEKFCNVFVFGLLTSCNQKKTIMKTEITPNKVKAIAVITLILLSSFLLNYSLVSYFVFDKAVSAIGLIIAAIIFGKSMMSMQLMRKK